MGERYAAVEKKFGGAVLEVIMEEVLHVRGERSKRNRRKLLVN